MLERGFKDGDSEKCHDDFVLAQELLSDGDILIRDGGSVEIGLTFVLVGVLQISAFERAVNGLLALGAAADRTDLAVDSGTMAARLAAVAENAIHVPQYRRRGRKSMRTNLFIKVIVEHDEKETPERLGAELCRQLERNYIVREAELANFTKVED